MQLLLSSGYQSTSDWRCDEGWQKITPQSLLPLHLLVQALDFPCQAGHLPPQLLSCCRLQTPCI